MVKRRVKWRVEVPTVSKWKPRLYEYMNGDKMRATALFYFLAKTRGLYLSWRML